MQKFVICLLTLFSTVFCVTEGDRNLRIKMDGRFCSPALVENPVSIQLNHDQMSHLVWNPGEGLRGSVTRYECQLEVNGEEIQTYPVGDFFFPCTEQNLSQLMLPIPIPSIEIKAVKEGEKFTVESIRCPNGWKVIEQLAGVEGMLRMMFPTLIQQFDPTTVWTIFGSLLECTSRVEETEQRKAYVLTLRKERSTESLADFIKKLAGPREDHIEGWLPFEAAIREKYGSLMETFDLDLTELLYLFGVRASIHKFLDSDLLSAEEAVEPGPLEEALTDMVLDTSVQLEYEIEVDNANPIDGDTRILADIQLNISDGKRECYINLDLALEGGAYQL